MRKVRVKELREQKAWSQAHLADAAGVNIRTVQRIEGGEPFSYETMLSLASVLGIDVLQLEPKKLVRSGLPALSITRATVAAIAMLPCVLFVGVNLLRSVAGLAGPYEVLALLGMRLVAFETFNAVSPVLFLAGIALAIAICLPTLIGVRLKVELDTIQLNSIRLGTQRAPLVLVAIALASGGLMIAHAGLEQYRMLVPWR